MSIRGVAININDYHVLTLLPQIKTPYSVLEMLTSSHANHLTYHKGNSIINMIQLKSKFSIIHTFSSSKLNTS